jgi:thioredoxin 1
MPGPGSGRTSAGLLEKLVVAGEQLRHGAVREDRANRASEDVGDAQHPDLVRRLGSERDVTDATFEGEVLEAETAVLVDFWAPWCGPCRMVSPILEEINEERADLRVVKLNVDENQATAIRFEVLSIPTMILFKDGEIAKKLIGAQPKARIEAELEPALA